MEKPVVTSRQYISSKFGPFLDKILELWPDTITTTNCVNLGPVYAKMLHHIPSIKRSDEDRMGSIIGNESRLEKDLRLTFLTVVINHFYFDYLENEHDPSGGDESNLSKSGSNSDDESDDSDFNSQDAYHPNIADGDESSSSSSSSSSDSSSGSKKSKSSSTNLFKQRSETSTSTLEFIWIDAIKKNDKYANAFKSLVLGVDKAVQYLYPFMSKIEKDVFNSTIIDERIMREFKLILKDNITFLKNGTLPIEKNTKAKTSSNSGEEDAVGAYLTESDNTMPHVSKKQKK